jgi:hypothetical protein
MSDWDTEPYQEREGQLECAFCERLSQYKFCSDKCAVAFWND